MQIAQLSPDVARSSSGMGDSSSSGSASAEKVLSRCFDDEGTAIEDSSEMSGTGIDDIAISFSVVISSVGDVGSGEVDRSIGSFSVSNGYG